MYKVLQKCQGGKFDEPKASKYIKQMTQVISLHFPASEQLDLPQTYIEKSVNVKRILHCTILYIDVQSRAIQSCT